MRIRIPLLVAGFLLTGAGIAVAETVVIAPEQETVIREYVKSKPIASIDLYTQDRPGHRLMLAV